MDSGIRSHQRYEIIESCLVGNTELVIGHNSEAPNPYACQFRKGCGSYYQGYYCNSIKAAREKLYEHYQSESHIPYNNIAA